MPNIAIIINSIRNHGPGKVVQSLIKGIYKNYNITLITLADWNDPNVVQKLKELNVEVIELNYKNKLSFIFTGFYKINKILNSKPYEIVHGHGILSDYIISKLVKNSYRISTLHCNIYEDYSTRNKIVSKFMIYIHEKALQKMHLTICCSKSVYTALKPNIKNIDFVVNGIDIEESKNLEEENIREKLNIPNNAVVFTYLGSLTKRKNVEFLVRNFKQYHNSNSYLLIVGEGEEREKCEQYADSNIKFLGFKENALEYLKISDIYCSSSKSEGMSISIIEALSQGLLLFLSDIPSHNEAVSESNVYLGETFTEENFSLKLNTILDKVQNVNKTEIINFQKEHLSSNSMCKEYLKKYNQVMEK